MYFHAHVYPESGFLVCYIYVKNCTFYCRWFIKLLLRPVWKQGEKDSHTGSRWSRKDNHLVSSAGGGGGHDNTK